MNLSDYILNVAIFFYFNFIHKHITLGKLIVDEAQPLTISDLKCCKKDIGPNSYMLTSHIMTSIMTSSSLDISTTWRKMFEQRSFYTK